MRAMVDSRQPRLGHALTGLALAAGFLAGRPEVLPALAVVLGAAAVLGPGGNLYAYLFRGLKRVAGLGPPRELEEAGPPRFANAVGFVFVGAASIAYYVAGSTVAAWTLGVLVSAMALLSATTGLCLACELYVLGRRFLTRGRVPSRVRAVPAAGIREDDRAA